MKQTLLTNPSHIVFRKRTVTKTKTKEVTWNYSFDGEDNISEQYNSEGTVSEESLQDEEDNEESTHTSSTTPVKNGSCWAK